MENVFVILLDFLMVEMKWAGGGGGGHPDTFSAPLSDQNKKEPATGELKLDLVKMMYSMKQAFS